MDGWNYFNYFTEIEEYFWKKRGAHLLVSPLDWAIMETWQKAGVPLEAVLKGIDSAFESYGRSRRGAGKPLKSLAYCTDAVLDAAAEIQEAAAGAQPKTKKPTPEPFSRDELRAFFERNVKRMADYAAAHKKQLRPHAKTHKCAEIARRQRAAGAVGICVATVPEAVVMASAGIEGVLLTSPIMSPPKVARMVSLAACPGWSSA